MRPLAPLPHPHAVGVLARVPSWRGRPPARPPFRLAGADRGARARMGVRCLCHRARALVRCPRRSRRAGHLPAKSLFHLQYKHMASASVVSGVRILTVAGAACAGRRCAGAEHGPRMGCTSPFRGGGAAAVSATGPGPRHLSMGLHRGTKASARAKPRLGLSTNPRSSPRVGGESPQTSANLCEPPRLFMNLLGLRVKPPRIFGRDSRTPMARGPV